MSSATDEQPTVEYQRYELTVYSDGSVYRAPFHLPLVPACPSPSNPTQVASLDVTLNPTLGTSLRFFLPPPSSSSPPPARPQKLPIILYFHGSAFLHFCTSVRRIHDYLCRLALHVNALIVSVDYRLAPEHPFPAAYEDCFEGLLWLNQQARLGASGEPWLANHGDFSRCFIAGDSAGATIVHYVAMQAVGHGSWESQHQDKALEHVAPKGLLLFHPYFRSGRSGAPESSDDGLESSLFKYLRIGPEDPLLDPLSAAAPSLAIAPLPRTLVFVAGIDALKEGGVLYYEGLLKAGKQVKLSEAENENHVFHLFFPDSPNVLPLLDEVKDFINA